MARTRASAPKTSAPARSPAPAPAPARAPAPAAQSTAHNNNTHNTHNASAPPQVTNVYVQRGGGGGTGMLGTMAAVAGGSVIGHGISNYLYGQGNQAAPTQPAQAQELAQEAQKENHPCASQLVGYSKCLDANPETADSCKWAWDYFQQCQSKPQ